MVLSRRGFLASCIALSAAPAIVRADSLMRIAPRKMVLVCDLRFVSPTVWYLKEAQDRVGYIWVAADNAARAKGLLVFKNGKVVYADEGV